VKVPLTSGAYEARGVIASAQRCENLFFEPNPEGASPFPGTHYPASGLTVFADYTGVFTGWVRGLSWSSRGDLYAVIGSALIRQLDVGRNYQLVGDIGNSGAPVTMVDNGTTMVVVDGSPNGWTVDLTTQAFAAINDPAFYGATRVDFIDTFFIFNKPGTQAFYTSNSNATTFDPLYFAEKIGYNDILMSLVALHDNIWLFGAVTTEIWFNSGAPDFPFQRMPNTILQFGCIAPYSVVVAGNAVYWLTQDRQGRAIVMRGEGYQAKRVSTFAVENAWADYPAITDTYGMAYQQAGHEIVLFYFQNNDPSGTGVGNATWAYDTTADQWHRRTYGPNRVAWLPVCIAHWGSVYNISTWNNVVAGDRTGPRLLEIARHAYTDCGTPIERIRSWPHLMNDQKRLVHSQFVAALQPGQLSPDAVSLRWSDDGGQTFGQPVTQTVNGATNGQYSWRRLGMARDRVYELSWTGEGQTALNGAWIEAVPAAT
jgi:hypothetical protein